MWIEFFGRLLLCMILISLAWILFGAVVASCFSMYDEWAGERRKRSRR